MWFLKLHWFWKFLIISWTGNVAYALVKRGSCPTRNGRWGAPKMIRWA